ncbi:PREDICTED: uncharacterized protein LOC107187467 [Dufourea novaeangliae]|uniref:uncharacterized protein LOC107187467 n=1 Tax=Dufourea novaeangliae TaxID=178035 RepID=UPI000767DE90|nr:PREDICTED: uncharacterized protein LOC107187467 [Dufourea novaeangliae]
MRSPSVPVCFVYVLLSVLALSLQTCATSSSNSTSTQVAVEEEDEESLPQITLDEFKERYRRLIPYMTFYVANNYVNSQTPLPQVTEKEYQSSALVRQNQQPLVRVNNVARKVNFHRVIPQNHDQKFVPSVQYDPHSLGSDNNYFTPVRHTAKSGHDDHPAPYQVYQDRKVIYPDIIPSPSQITRKEHRYYTNHVRPLRPYTTNGREHLPRKQLTKPVHSNIRDDYALDYNVRPTVNGVHYPAMDFHGHRPGLPPAYSTVSTLAPIQGKQLPTIHQLIRNPNINLEQIVESLHLSERLPEMLNRDNIDNSLKTLAEILDILHSKKTDEFPQVQQAPLTPLVKAPSRLPQKVPNVKPRPQSRPKVITETRFQATPNPLYLTEDPERYKLTSYEDEINPLPPPQPSYVEDSLNNNKLLEYYTPVVQDVPAKNKDVFLPTIRPHANHQSPSDGPTENTYEITEDLGEDVLQQDRYTPSSPATTESPVYSYTKPNEISTPKYSVPQTSVKHGATQGEAHVDYPAYSTIPLTNFSCKEQRYKGFFGDPDTGCQVWHYCDLNGGKSSFLCPNGTIFSQVALTCDWWFNVKCETTTQLYVLNERLYKYILPVMPKFPEDFTGPEVDRYLELKFKEMEAKLKEKLKKEEKEKLKDKPETEK